MIKPVEQRVQYQTTLRTQNFPLRFSSVNVTKSAASCGFGEENLNGKLHFLWSAAG